jgi:hypothetical protein
MPRELVQRNYGIGGTAASIFKTAQPSSAVRQSADLVQNLQLPSSGQKTETVCSLELV